jgi:hypothetical protein
MALTHRGPANKHCEEPGWERRCGSARERQVNRPGIVCSGHQRLDPGDREWNQLTPLSADGLR